MNKRPFFSEIIQSNLQQWTAQSWDWRERPHFATLMALEEKEYVIFGLVCAIETGSWQTGRTPFPYQKTEEELLQEQPHIFEFLQTKCTCLTLGYRLKSGEIIYQYAPQPPKIHAFVRPATAEETALFFSDDRYLSLIFAAGALYNLDELLLALLQFRSKTKTLSAIQLQNFIDTYSLLTGNDYRRLKLFLHRAQPLLTKNV